MLIPQTNSERNVEKSLAQSSDLTNETYEGSIHSDDHDHDDSDETLAHDIETSVLEQLLEAQLEIKALKSKLSLFENVHGYDFAQYQLEERNTGTSMENSTDDVESVESSILRVNKPSSNHLNSDTDIVSDIVNGKVTQAVDDVDVFTKRFDELSDSSYEDVVTELNDVKMLLLQQCCITTRADSSSRTDGGVTPRQSSTVMSVDKLDSNRQVYDKQTNQREFSLIDEDFSSLMNFDKTDLLVEQISELSKGKVKVCEKSVLQTGDKPNMTIGVLNNDGRLTNIATSHNRNSSSDVNVNELVNHDEYLMLVSFREQVQQERHDQFKQAVEMQILQEKVSLQFIYSAVSWL